jgi:predicted transposase YbfD/YdcC
VAGTFTRKSTGKTEKLLRHYITSRERGRVTARELGAQVRGHWTVENPNHWRRDALWGEDRCRIRDANSACALALLRTTLISLIKWNHRNNFVEVFEDVANDLSLGLDWLAKSKFR